jgi:hypothetical protein
MKNLMEEIKKILEDGCGIYTVWFSFGETELNCLSLDISNYGDIILYDSEIGSEYIDDFGDFYLTLLKYERHEMYDIIGKSNKSSKEYILTRMSIDNKNQKILFTWHKS